MTGRKLRRSAFAAGLAGTAVAPRAARAQIGSFVATSTIAVAVPLSGPLRRSGEQIGDGVRQAVDDYNRAKSSFERGFLMRAFDDQNALAGALVAADFATNDTTVIAVIGHLSASATVGTERSYGIASMPLIVPTSSADAVTQQPQHKLVRLATRDTDEGRLHAIRALEDDRPKSVVTVMQDGDYGNDVARAFASYVDEKKLPSRIVVFGIEKPNYAGAATAVVEQKPDLVFLAGTVKDMGPLVAQLRTAGYTGAFRAPQGFFDAGTAALGLDGIVVSSSMPPLALAPSVFQIRQDFESRYGAMTPLNAFGYASAQIAIAAVKRAATVSRVAVLQALQTPIPFATVVGQFTFNGRGDSFDPNVYFYKLDQGKWAYQRAAHPSTFIIR